MTMWGFEMESKEYQEAALSTDLKDRGYEETVLDRVGNKHLLRLIHASLGLTTETAEIADAIKKHMMYGKPLDETNLLEEVGDVLWYANVLLNEIGASFDEAMAANIRKLKKRYPQGFTEQSAINRNVEEETKALKGVSDDQ